MDSTLVAWIGASDLAAAASGGADGLGPIAQAMSELRFDRAMLLSNYADEKTTHYADWLKGQSKSEIDTFRENLASPTNFVGIYQAALRCLEDLASSGAGLGNLTYHLSPGTSAMAAIWIILSQTSYPARLIESSRAHGVQTVQFPFDLAADFLPDLMGRASQRMQEGSAAAAPVSANFGDLVFQSTEMRDLCLRARKAAEWDVPVLIEGESGTGKELLARAIHAASPRTSKPFVAINCGAIPETLIESELFGYERGAFTGAQQSTPGHFERADTGTVFLDELGELSLSAQVKFLRFLQEGEVQRIGGKSPKKISVRVIGATNRELLSMVQLGTFREDLFYRLAAAVLHVPPLRNRRGDLAPLLDYYMSELNRTYGGKDKSAHKILSAGARKVLVSHQWPGNIRELISTLQRAYLWSSARNISASDAAQSILGVVPKDTEDAILGRPLGSGLKLQELLYRVEHHYLERALIVTGGNKSRAAKLLGFQNYQTLSNWLRRHGLEKLARR